jgi:hypothetical protein
MSHWIKGLMEKATSPPSVSVLVQRIQETQSKEEKRKAISDLKTLSENLENAKVVQYFMIIIFECCH